MARQTRMHRRGAYRPLPVRAAWNRVSRAQLRRTLAALGALSRR
jgi:hypothetical protein